jgi:hypothetical protein
VFKHLKVEHVDGTVVDVEGRKADVVRFERHFKMPAGRIFSDEGLYVEHLWFYAWLAEARKAEVGDFETWMESVESVEIVTEDDDSESPTDPSPSPSA